MKEAEREGSAGARGGPARGCSGRADWGWGGQAAMGEGTGRSKDGDRDGDVV